MPKLALWEIVFSFAVGCASVTDGVRDAQTIGDADSDSGSLSGPRIELGTGTARFEPLVDGQTLAMVRGAQGGWHLWVSIRSYGLDADAGRLTLRKGLEGGTPDSDSVGVRFDPVRPDGSRDYLGWPAVLADPSCAVGNRIQLVAELVTSTGQRLTDEVVIVADGGESPPPPCP